MVSIARKNLFQEKTRVAMSSCGIAFAILLIVTVVGVYNSLGASMSGSIINSGSDIWVSAEGSAGTMHSMSILSPGMLENLRQIEGVLEVKPLVRTGLTTEIKGKNVSLVLTGYDVESGIGGPWNVIQGASKPANGEVIVDRVLAAKNGLEIGDNIKLADNEFKIVGISDGTSFFILYGVFIPFEDAFALRSGIVNNYLVLVDESASREGVITSIEENIVGVSALTSEDFAQRTASEILGGFTSIIFVIVAVGVVVGTAVVGLTIYTLTVERTREHGILKAVGANNWYLYKIVVEQALVVSMIGLLSGGLLSGVVLYFAGILVPELTVLVTTDTIMSIFVLVCFMGLLASYLPVRKVAKIDPAIVFKT